MTLTTGAKLGPYEIVAPLGAGGMGEVYRARDTRLDRTVAIKILPASLSDNPDARQRFQREAKAISALQHPNICAMYDIGSENGIDFLVLEYLEGDTLQDRLLRGLLPLEQVTRHGMEIADALDAAHRKGFVHRDLKPSNVFLTRHGEAKVLDFGLVKLEEEASTDQRTITSPANLTSPGSALGTVAYMSPEQARGDEVDSRTDIFSFGAVLYEMTAGKPAFPGKTSAVIFKAILDQTPAAPSQLNPEFPPRLEEIIFKALEKDRDVRYQSAADIRADLKRLRRDTESASGANTDRADKKAQTKTWWRTKLAIIVGVLATVALAAAAYFFRARTNQTIDSIAVLPFTNADPSMEYLSDGITDGIIDRLSGLPNIKVISRTSAFRYKKRDIEPQKIARELGVQALVTGRVIQRGDELSVSAELVDTREDKQLWGEQYDRHVTDIASVQQEIANSISGNLRVRLTSEEKTRLSKPDVANAEAYQLFLKGRYHANQFTADGYKKGIEYFQQAIDKDPNYALAYAGLADSYGGLGGGTAYAPPRETLPKAKAAATKALELDETLGDAHAALGYAGYFSDWKWPSAEREFRRAIELNPNSAISHARYSEILGTQERFDDSVAEGERAQKLDPLSAQVLAQLGSAYLSARRYDEAIAQFQSALELNPEAGIIRVQLAWTYGAKRMYPQAIAECEKISEPEKTMTTENQTVASGVGWVYAVAGRRADALKLVKESKDLSSHAYVDPYNIAVIYAGLGDKDEAFRWLEKGYQQRSSGMPYLTIDPFWSEMRSDPRYADLLRRMASTRPSD